MHLAKKGFWYSSEVEYVVAHGISSYLGDKKAVIGSAHFVLEDENISVTPAQQKQIDENINGYSAIYLAVGGELTG
ncbi:MAG: heavy metal translocating P-type ATPase, partial [Lachnospiraceae bacterium]|nr:heavy metal translocating P-type ATPase [Lachnospiraceae bacterium]